MVSFLNVNSELLETYSEPTRNRNLEILNYSKPLAYYSAQSHH